ncbi:hypothetical protein M3Y97_00913000 [Aphelenchoides bicaudatus]|nr:hypothetical protein M3Y97_00913000 [Aphelenchoides bicaudatus]
MKTKELKQKKRDDRLLMKICRCFRQGLSVEETFVHICDEMKIADITLDQLKTLLDSSSTNSKNPFKSNKSLQDLFKKVATEFGKFRHAICTWPFKYHELTFLNSRYLLRVTTDDLRNGRVQLLDIFHNKAQIFLMEGLSDYKDKFIKGYFLEAINFEFLLFFEHEEEPGDMNIYLLQLQPSESKYTVISTSTIYVNYNFTIVFNYKDRRKLLIWDDYSGTTLWVVTVNKLEIVVEEPIDGDPNEVFNTYYSYYMRIVGDKLQCVVFKFGDDDDTQQIKNIEFGEYTLISGSTNSPSYTKLFDIRFDETLQDIWQTKYFWTDDKCYFICKNDSNLSTKQYEVKLIDLNERRIVKTNCYFNAEGVIKNLQVDEDGVLTLYTDNCDGNSTIYRLSIDQPDSLLNLCFFKLRRESMFFGIKACHNILSILPSYMQPCANISNLPGEESPTTSKQVL